VLAAGDSGGTSGATAPPTPGHVKHTLLAGRKQRERRRAAEQTGGGRIGSAAARVSRSRTSARSQQDQIEPESVVARDEEVQGPISPAPERSGSG
jgi:hypothetical protein